MKIIDSYWFTEMGSTKPIGIIVAEDETTGERKAYVGTGEGLDEYKDAHSILERGARLGIPTASDIYTRLRIRGKR